MKIEGRDVAVDADAAVDDRNLGSALLPSL